MLSWLSAPISLNLLLTSFIKFKKSLIVLNFDASFEYLITKQFSAFAQVNNIASQYYSKYYDFKNFGLNFIVGVTYSFGDEPLRKPKGKR